jgi:hypothetical protein
MSLSEELGSFFQSYDIYLQDPVNCDLDIKYCNPHRLSSVDFASCPMTSAINSPNPLELMTLESVPEHSELLAILNTNEDLPEALQPDAIQTPLERQESH